MIPMKEYNQSTQRVQLVMALQALTRLLGKLGLKKLAISYGPFSGMSNNVMPRPPAGYPIYYGFTLKEAKDCAERYMNKIGAKY